MRVNVRNDDGSFVETPGRVMLRINQAREGHDNWSWAPTVLMSREFYQHCRRACILASGSEFGNIGTAAGLPIQIQEDLDHDCSLL